MATKRQKSSATRRRKIAKEKEGENGLPVSEHSIVLKIKPRPLAISKPLKSTENYQDMDAAAMLMALGGTAKTVES